MSRHVLCATLFALAAASSAAGMRMATVPPTPPTTAAAGANSYFPFTNDVPRCADPTIQNETLYYTMLEASAQMPAQVVAVRIGVPFEQLVAFFDIPSAWPLWNHLFATNFVTNYDLCADFNNVSYTNAPPVSPPFPAGMTAPHWIDQHGYDSTGNVFAFGWIFQLNTAAGDNLVYGRHTFTIKRYVDASGVLASTVESWEKAAGPQLDTPVNVNAWVVGLQESRIDAANGFLCLERVYTRYARLSVDLVNATCNPFTP